MLISDVNFPDKLLTAPREGRLVIFAGAGVSMGPPSNYPDFKKLAIQVAQQSGFSEPEPNEPVERFLGRIKSQGVDVHSIVRQKLTDPASKPSQLHFGLISLFKSAADVRIVTTNFDNHLSAAAIELLGARPETYRAPALPLGHRFKGVVYLHGSVEQEPEELILTDIDFGRAYLTEAWATRFLLGLFSNFTVLFVGYSHEDTILKYLARGLPPGTDRYALVRSDDSSELWENIGVSKILFPKTEGGNEYRALPTAITEWAKRNRMGFLDHEERISQIVSLSPPLDQNEIAYIEDILKRTATARLFASYARSPEWLRWCENRGLLDALFDPHGKANDLADELSKWFAANFVGNQSEDGLGTIQRKGPLLSAILWNRIAWHTWHHHDEIDPVIRAKWIILLLRSAPHVLFRNQFLEYNLSACRPPDDNRSALLLFEYLVTPEVVLEKAIDLSAYGETTRRQARFKVSLVGDDYWVRQSWQQVFHPHIESFASDLEPIVTSRLQQIHSLLRATGEANETWDPVSYGRSAIEEHGQNSGLYKIDILIEAARDIIECLLVTNSELASSILSKWAASESPILQRLAIYGIAKSEHVSPDAKIAWVLDEGWLFRTQLKHEVFQLLNAAYPASNEATKNGLLEQAMANLAGQGTEPDEALHADYRVYNLLVWLSQAAPDCPITSEKLQYVQSLHPEFAPREHPDLDHWMTFSWGAPFDEESASDPRYQQFQTEELLSREPESIVESLIAEQASGHVMNNVTQAVRESFDWRWKLAEALRTRAVLGTPLGNAMIRGWTRTRLSETDWTNVLGLLQSEQTLLVHASTIAELLAKSVDIPDGSLPYSLLSQIETMSEMVWPLLEAEHPDENAGAEDADPEDWLFEAINSPGGQVVNFWIYGLSKRRSEGKEEWQSLPENARGFFERVLVGTSRAAEMGRIVMAAHFSFLHSNDSDWSTRQLLPLFDWSRGEKQAEQAWNGFLHIGRWDAAACNKLLPFMTQLFPLLSVRLAKLREMIINQLAGVFVHYEPGEWLSQFLVGVQNEDRARFASYVAYYLRPLSDDTKRVRWDGWISGYWYQRLQGIPRQLSAEELKQMIEWSLELEPVFDSVVELISASSAPTLGDGFLFYLINEQGLSNRHPEAVAGLLEHLLPAASECVVQSAPFMAILDDLMDANIPADRLRRITDSLLRLGAYVSPHLRGYIGGA
ncbi:MAG TPA: DUF4020 domain-containing protein [Blastocatellia bacterium]|nr:DUF4020 domain-containing protein [Blastocatellia bacterium]